MRNCHHLANVCASGTGIKTLDDVYSKVDKTDSKFTFIGALTKALECVVCKGVMTKPMISTCCQRLVGCSVCVQRWISRNNRCPHCSADTGMGQLKELKGLEEMLTAARVLNEDSKCKDLSSIQNIMRKAVTMILRPPHPRIRLNM